MYAESPGRRRKVLLFAALLLAISAPGMAWAACARGDLKGKYELHIFASTQEGSTTWTRCAMTVKADGGLKSGTDCSNDRGTEGQLKGGKLKLGRSCAVTGTIKIDGAIATVEHGLMNREKSGFNALGKSDNGLILQLTATRR